MSRPCPILSCGRMIVDDREWFGCTQHWFRVSRFTRDRIIAARTVLEHDTAVAQAFVEMVAAA